MLIGKGRGTNRSQGTGVARKEPCSRTRRELGRGSQGTKG
jgi:hypothetical protein